MTRERERERERERGEREREREREERERERERETDTDIWFIVKATDPYTRLELGGWEVGEGVNVYYTSALSSTI